MTQEELISGRDGELADLLTTKLGTNLETYGIKVEKIETKMLDLPDENKEAVYDRMISERNNIAASYIAQAGRGWRDAAANLGTPRVTATSGS